MFLNNYGNITSKEVIDMRHWNVYMDCCCYNRPYDDLSNVMVRLESEAILSIIDQSEQKALSIYGSEVLIDELNRMTDKVKFEKVSELYESSTTNMIELTDSIISRATELIAEGIKPFDALHVSSAESVNADVFLTTDKRLLNVAKRIGFNVDTDNPAVWLLEVLLSEQQS